MSNRHCSDVGHAQKYGAGAWRSGRVVIGTLPPARSPSESTLRAAQAPSRPRHTRVTNGTPAGAVPLFTGKCASAYSFAWRCAWTGRHGAVDDRVGRCCGSTRCRVPDLGPQARSDETVPGRDAVICAEQRSRRQTDAAALLRQALGFRTSCPVATPRSASASDRSVEADPPRLGATEELCAAWDGRGAATLKILPWSNYRRLDRQAHRDVVPWSYHAPEVPWTLDGQVRWMALAFRGVGVGPRLDPGPFQCDAVGRRPPSRRLAGLDDAGAVRADVAPPARLPCESSAAACARRFRGQS